MKRSRGIIFLFALLPFLFIGCKDKEKTDNKQTNLVKEENSEEPILNPIHDGYFADPEIVKEDDTYFIYATIDPWGGEKLAVLETKDFKSFKTHQLNWPTKKDNTSSTSGDAMVWAPDVVKAKDQKYYMYISVGSEIWAGESDKPLGPWKNAKEDDTPLIRSTLYPDYHMIDAHCFIDDDGQVYLFWGSGLNWINGRCFAVKLKDDMVSFDGEIKDVTPPNYFEAPYMFKRNDKYYMTYSDGKAIDSTYKIRYAVSDSPLGPWEEGQNSPIAKTDSEKNVYGPGHNSIFMEEDQYYLLYHQIYPQEEDYVLRQLRLDSLNFDQEGNIQPISYKGVHLFTK